MAWMRRYKLFSLASAEALCTTYVSPQESLPHPSMLVLRLTRDEQCADIKFKADAQLLADDQCKNGTGVSGVAIANVQGSSTSSTPSGSAAPSPSSGAASRMGLVAGSGLVAAVVAWSVL
jgi:hypothetical protein